MTQKPKKQNDDDVLLLCLFETTFCWLVVQQAVQKRYKFKFGESSRVRAEGVFFLFKILLSKLFFV